MEKQTRRSFLNKTWLLLGSLSIAEILVVMTAFFRPREAQKPLQKKDTVVVAGPVDSFESGSVNANVAGKFYLVRNHDGGFLAMSRRCTHLSCTVPWVAAENRFVCPCHSSQFDIRGNVIQPPAPRALDLHPIEIRNNMVRVDTAKTLKRSAFAPDQLTYPENT